MTSEKPDNPGTAGTAEQSARGIRDDDGTAHHDETSAARRAAVGQTAGALTGVYAPGELASLRDDWPA